MSSKENSSAGGRHDLRVRSPSRTIPTPEDGWYEHHWVKASPWGFPNCVGDAIDFVAERAMGAGLTPNDVLQWYYGSSNDASFEDAFGESVAVYCCRTPEAWIWPSDKNHFDGIRLLMRCVGYPEPVEHVQEGFRKHVEWARETRPKTADFLEEFRNLFEQSQRQGLNGHADKLGPRKDVIGHWRTESGWTRG